jgi:hypothetical protein
MKVAVLWLSSRTNSPESAVDTIAVAYDSMWHAGEKTLIGAIREDSGVSFVVSDAASVRQLKEDIRELFQTRREKLLRMRAEGWEAEIDVGVTVGDSAQYIVKISVEPSLLDLLGSLGVSLCFSAYPTSDDAEAQAV